MTITLLMALLAGSGIFLLFSGLVMPRRVRLEQPTQVRGLAALQAKLDAAELPITAAEFLTTCALVAAIGVVVAVLLGAPALAVAGVSLGPALVWQRLESQRDKFRQAYDESLAEGVQLLREGFSATGIRRGALDYAARNGPEPASSDLREVWRAMAAGTDLGDAFAADRGAPSQSVPADGGRSADAQVHGRRQCGRGTTGPGNDDPGADCAAARNRRRSRRRRGWN